MLETMLKIQYVTINKAIRRASIGVNKEIRIRTTHVKNIISRRKERG